MQFPERKGFCNPHDLSLHKQVKDIVDLLRPEMLRLSKALEESNGNISLYISFMDQIKIVKNEVANHDALFAFQNVLSHMIKAVEFSQEKKSNQEVLWHLQEVMAILFKVQNLPS